MSAKQPNSSSDERSGGGAKKRRLHDNYLADCYICPITGEFPLHPTTAEDGQCYERDSIKAWIAQHPAQTWVKSPVTGEPMGKKLFPALQLRNTLMRLVEQGVIGGEKCDLWKSETKLVETKNLADEKCKKDAKNGDIVAMRSMGFSCRDGLRGNEKNLIASFSWFKKAADKGDPPSSSAAAICYLEGMGVQCNSTRGIAMATQAAVLGSAHAAGLLGSLNVDGLHGLDKNHAEAYRWFCVMKNVCHVKGYPGSSYHSEATDFIEKYESSV